MATTPEGTTSAALAALEAVHQQGRLEALRQAKSALESVRDKVRLEIDEIDKEIDRLMSRPTTSRAQHTAATEGPNPDLDLPINELDLTVRAYNFLIKSGVKTVRDLTEKSENELQDIQGFGPVCMDDVKTKLAGLGLSLKDDAQA